MSAVVGIVECRPHGAGATGSPPPAVTQGWLRRFGRCHAVCASGVLLCLSFGWMLLGSRATSDAGASVLLVGGALIGVPHGASDFLTARRLFGESLGWLWLPVFVLIYLGLVLAGLAAWRISPGVTLLGFVVISSLHFAREDIGAYDLPSSPLRWLARASTPLVPIIMLHLSEVSPFFATMSGQGAEAIETALHPFRAPLLGGWLIGLTAMLLSNLSRSDPRRDHAAETFELTTLAVAAIVLPPLVTFAVYFCLIHAVRHMSGLTAGLHPYDGRRACTVSALIIGPSALVCAVLLACAWTAIGGVMTTHGLLCVSLQLVAALTVPHMILESMNRTADGRFADHATASG